MDLKRNRKIMLAILALLFPIVIFSPQLGKTLSMALLIGDLVVYLVALHFLWRCPACGHALGLPSRIPTPGPYCEKEL